MTSLIRIILPAKDISINVFSNWTKQFYLPALLFHLKWQISPNLTEYKVMISRNEWFIHEKSQNSLKKWTERSLSTNSLFTIPDYGSIWGWSKHEEIACNSCHRGYVGVCIRSWLHATILKGMQWVGHIFFLLKKQNKLKRRTRQKGKVLGIYLRTSRAYPVLETSQSKSSSPLQSQ